MARRVLCPLARRKAEATAARDLPDAIARSPVPRRIARPPPAPHRQHLATAPDAAMNKPEANDPNAELRDFEPLRVVLALGALLLGLVMSIH